MANVVEDKTVPIVSCHFAKSVAKCMRLKIVQHSTKDAMCVVKRDILRRLAIVEDVQQLEVVRNRGGTRPSRGYGRGRANVRVHFAEEDELSDMFEQNTSTHDVYTVQNNGNETNNKEWTVNMTVNNKHLRLEIDSGAQCNVLSRQIAEKFCAEFPILKSDARINGVSGTLIKALGKITLPCEYKNVKHNLTFQVIDGQRNLNLLGRDDSVKLGLIMRVNSTQMEIEQLIK